MNRIINLLRNINYLMKHSLWEMREQDIVFLTEKILDDGIYHYNLSHPDRSGLQILSKEESMRLIAKKNISFVRFGDGEINLLKGIDQPFQNCNKDLQASLFKLLNTPRRDLLVGLNRGYYLPFNKELINEYYKRNAFEYRRFFDENCSKDALYIDGSCTFYEFGNHSPEAEKFWNGWKELFREKALTIICGEGILNKIQYDVFEFAKSKEYIYGPRINAWYKHEEIMKRIKESVPKEKLLIFILGMAGKAMIPEVTDLGYVAWDIGHLAKGYNAYMTNMEATKENISDFFAPD